MIRPGNPRSDRIRCGRHGPVSPFSDTVAWMMPGERRWPRQPRVRCLRGSRAGGWRRTRPPRRAMRGFARAIKAAWVDECGADSDVRRRIGRRVLFFARAPDVEHISTWRASARPAPAPAMTCPMPRARMPLAAGDSAGSVRRRVADLAIWMSRHRRRVVPVVRLGHKLLSAPQHWHTQPASRLPARVRGRAPEIAFLTASHRRGRRADAARCGAGCVDERHQPRPSAVGRSGIRILRPRSPAFRSCTRLVVPALVVEGTQSMRGRPQVDRDVLSAPTA